MYRIRRPTITKRIHKLTIQSFFIDYNKAAFPLPICV